MQPRLPVPAATAETGRAPLPTALVSAVAVLSLVGWGLAALRHGLLQSTAFDLGIYDQVAWQISRGLEARSTLLGLHHMGNHGAWAFYLLGIPYRLLASVHWLFLAQAFGLIATAIPLWRLAHQAGLSTSSRWFVCLLWWLQPLVFNNNIWDFHPETMAMPLLAQAVLEARRGRAWAWWLCLVLLLGCRDGLTLVVIGLGLWQCCQRQWRWGLATVALGTGWLLLLSEWLYPLLNDGQGPGALARFAPLGNSIGEILLNLLRNPLGIAALLDLREVGFFLVLLLLPLAWLWSWQSSPILLAGLPLLAVNLLSNVEAQRDLLHHYNLPLAVLLVIAAIDGIASRPGLRRLLQTKRLMALAWLGLCWALLAKPGYFGSLYLSRLAVLVEHHQVLQSIPAGAAIAAPSHLAPHLSHRPTVELLRSPPGEAELRRWDHALLNPGDPGWGSSPAVMEQARQRFSAAGWRCQSVAADGLTLCRKPDRPG